MIDNRMKAARAKPKAIWYAWFPGDYASKTAMLTLVEHGAYRVLLDHYYQMGGKVVANATDLLRVCRAFAEAEQAAVSKVLTQFFVERDGYYHHERADAELEKRAILREKRALAGSAGGKQKVANATNLLGVCQTQQQLQQHEEEREESGQQGSVAIATPAPSPNGSASPPPFGKKPSKKKPGGVEGGIDLSTLEGAVVDYWNGIAEDNGLRRVRFMTATRRAKIAARVADYGGLDKFAAGLLDQIPHQPFLLGKNDRKWRVDLDWILEPSNAVKVSEGKYTNGHA